MGKIPGLLVFDFDNTLVSEDPEKFLYKWVARMAEEGDDLSFLRFENMPDVAKIQTDILRFAISKGKTMADIYAHSENKKLTPGMQNLLEKAKREWNFKILIVSDNNTVILDYMLPHLKITHLIDDVIANLGSFDSDGHPLIEPYKYQDHCPYSYKNMCKAEAIQIYVDKQKNLGNTFDFIGYVGDSNNDFCPAKRILKSTDMIFPRKGFALEKMLAEQKADFSVQIVPWSSGNDIVHKLEADLLKSSMR